MSRTTLRHRGVAHFVAFTLLVPSALSALQHFPADEDLRRMLRYLVEDGEAPAVVLGVLETDGSTRVVSYGSAGPDTRPLGPRSVFEIGSITKIFTGTLLADMVAGGEVALEDPVSTYLPPEVVVPTFGEREITLLDLATHTSGLPSVPDGFTPADPQNPYSDWTVEALYAWLSGHELRREPGAEFEYSNVGMGLLGHALSRAAGTSLRELMQEKLLEPLGMSMTGFSLEGAPEEWMVRGHSASAVVPYWSATEAIYGAGGLHSNVQDMLTYLKANVGPPDSELERSMRTAQAPQRSTGDGSDRVGFAWRSLSLNDRPIVQHGGSTAGFRTLIAFDPERRVGVVVLTNSGEYGSNLGADLIVHDPPPATPEVTVGPEALRSYAGVYTSDAGYRLFVRVEEEGYLTVQTTLDVRMRVHAESDSAFFAKREEWGITFHRDEEGTVTELILDAGGTENHFTRGQEEVPPPALVAGNVPVSMEDIARYEGTYDLRIGDQTLEYRVFGEDGRLVSQLGQNVSPIVPIGLHEFALVLNPTIRVVFTVENERAEAVTVHQGLRSDSGDRRR